MVNNKNKKAVYIIESLKNAGAPVSGEMLGRELSVSRTAVWKIIRKLQESGYKIRSGRAGYTLDEVTDKPLPWELGLNLENLSYFDVVGSTMTEAERLIWGGCRNGAAVIAGKQTGGISKNGGGWSSPEGGVYFTRVRTAFLPCRLAELYLQAAAFTAAEVINRTCGAGVVVRPPGELIARGKKLGGLITGFAGRGGTITSISTGVGINADTPAGRLPEGAVSLAEITGAQVSVKKLTGDLLKELERTDALFSDDADENIEERLKGHLPSMEVGK